MIGRSNFNQKTYYEVEDELAEVNHNIIEQIITATGAFDPKADEKAHSNFSPSKSKRGGSPLQPGSHKQGGTYFPEYKLTPDQMRKKQFVKQLMRLKPED